MTGAIDVSEPEGDRWVGREPNQDAGEGRADAEEDEAASRPDRRAFPIT